MNKSSVEYLVKDIQLNRRPNGFIYIILNRWQKLYCYDGCIELRSDDHSTSFHYSIFKLDPYARTYEFSLFVDKERNGCIFSALVSYIDECPQTAKFEVVTATGKWREFEEETAKIFHILFFEGIIDSRRPQNSDGTHSTRWRAFFNGRLAAMIKEHMFFTLKDVIIKINYLLS